jgi:Protein of unknown function (DUF1214)
MIEIRCNILPASGAKTYRLRFPPNAPVKNFWSMTIYDVNTRTLIQILAHRPVEKCRRLHRPPCRADGADGLREEPGPERARPSVVFLFPALRADRSALRQDVGAAGLREGDVATGSPHQITGSIGRTR